MSDHSQASESEEDVDSWDDEEDLKDYRRGGYHPIKPGDRFSDGRYRVLCKVGWGHFSTVWLAWDERHDEGRGRPAVLKVQKSADRYAEAAKDEVKLLSQVSVSPECLGRDQLVMMIDHFVHRGVNGQHHVMCFEPLGPSLLSLIKETHYQGLPVGVVRRVARCVLLALAHLTTSSRSSTPTSSRRTCSPRCSRGSSRR